jgi:hypothetical protein
MLDLQIHLRERFLHVLNVLRGHFNQLLTMAQDRAHGTDLVLGPESSPQQTD